MRLTFCIGLAFATITAAPAAAQPASSAVTIHRGAETVERRDSPAYAPYVGGDAAYGSDTIGPGRFALRGGDVPFREAEGLNAFFYPDGYDPQYGSEGRLPDADDFAETYGCAPVWNGKYGYYVPACN